MGHPGYVQTLVRFLSTLTYESIPKEVIKDTKKYILDTIGTSLAGSIIPGAEMLCKCFEEKRSSGATIIGRGNKKSLEDAALINCYLAFYQELDSGHRLGGVHSACVVVPAALALAEIENLSGKSFIESIIVGTELYSRLGVASAKAQYERGNDPTGTASALGSAATASKALRLEEKKFLDAVNIACAMTPLSPELSILNGEMAKGLTNGIGARNGILAANLAKLGLTGCRDSLLGKEGYLWVTTNGKFDPKLLTSKLGSKFEISNMYYKIHSSCSWTHSAIDAALELSKENPELYRKVKSISVRTFHEAAKIASNTDPKDEIEAKFSIPYTVAIALMNGKVGVEEFSSSNLSSPIIKDLMRKIIITDDPELHDAYPDRSRPAIVDIVTEDGDFLSKRVDFPKGFPENPLSQDEIKVKFQMLANPIIGEEKCAEIVQFIDSLDNIKSMRMISEILF